MIVYFLSVLEVIENIRIIYGVVFILFYFIIVFIFFGRFLLKMFRVLLFLNFEKLIIVVKELVI